MVIFRHMYGAVYILENIEAQKVKVGMTINKVVNRLSDVNDKWTERKGTCQICGVRLVLNGIQFPKHVLSGINCSGGNRLPLEAEVSLAETHMMSLQSRLQQTSGSEKGSIARKIKTLERRIEQYRYHSRPIGLWKVSTVFYTERAEQVELLSHALLADHLDRSAPIGEVFNCSSLKATEAVEAALKQLDLLNSARKESGPYTW